MESNGKKSGWGEGGTWGWTRGKRERKPKELGGTEESILEGVRPVDEP